MTMHSTIPSRFSSGGGGSGGGRYQTIRRRLNTMPHGNGEFVVIVNL